MIPSCLVSLETFSLIRIRDRSFFRENVNDHVDMCLIQVAVAEAIHSTFLDSVSSMPTRVAVDAGRILREADHMVGGLVVYLKLL